MSEVIIIVIGEGGDRCDRGISTPRQRGAARLIDVENMRRSMINGVVSVDGGVIDIQLV